MIFLPRQSHSRNLHEASPRGMERKEQKLKTSTIYSKAWKNKLDTIQTTFIYIEKENKKLQKFSMDASLYSLYIVYCIYLRLSENIVYTLRLSGKGKFVHNFDPK